MFEAFFHWSYRTNNLIIKKNSEVYHFIIDSLYVFVKTSNSIQIRPEKVVFKSVKTMIEYFSNII